MKPYSRDLREKVVAAAKQEPSSLRVAERFGVSGSWVRKLRLRVKKGGNLDPMHGGGRERLVTGEHADAVRDISGEKPDATLNEMRRQLKKRTGLKVSEPTMSRTMRRLGLTHKRKSIEASERERPDVQAKRRTFKFRSFWWDVERLVFVDETGVNLAMTRRYGWGPIGERVVGQAPFHWGENATLVAALTLDGLEAPFLFPGAMDTQAIRVYVAQVLVPRLRRDDIVLWDNLSVHEDSIAAASIEQAGARLEFLPPYSPDLNPIEMAWSKVKERLRQMAERTWQRLQRAACDAMKAITPSDCRGWFRHCGYPLRFS
jgi:transposase